VCSSDLALLNGINETMETIVKPISNVQTILTEISEGDLTKQITNDYEGDFAVLKNSVNRTSTELEKTLSVVSASVEQFTTGAAQVAESGKNLSSSASEQASSIEEITSTMMEISSQSQKNSENARKANELSSSAKHSAEYGNGKMKSLLRAMDDINNSSTQISRIIKVIDEIAFQTNLLALNAAVEAAREGTHGKGFAVVAEEVRNLAQRSAKAANETTDLIEESVDRVKKGNQIANETAKALTDIIDSVNDVNNLVDEITFSSNDQAKGIEQVNEALGQVDKITQRNSASAEGSAAIFEELSLQGNELKKIISRFKLKRSSQQMRREEKIKPTRITSLVKSKDQINTKEFSNPFKSENTLEEIRIELDDTDFGSF